MVNIEMLFSFPDLRVSSARPLAIFTYFLSNGILVVIMADSSMEVIVAEELIADSDLINGK